MTTNIYILKADGSIFGTKVSELFKQLKTYPTLNKAISLSSSEDYEHPLQTISIEHTSYERFNIQLSTDFPCPEFHSLVEIIRKRKLQWAIICISVFTGNSLMWKGDFDYFCDYFFNDMWKNFTNNHALPMPTTQSQSNVTIEELKEENNAMQTANGYPISAYQVSEPQFIYQPYVSTRPQLKKKITFPSHNSYFCNRQQ